MKRLLLILALLLAFPPFASAQGISQLQQFTSTTSPASAITQTLFGKAFRLTGQGSGCAQFSSNGTLSSTGVSCGTGSGGSSFAYPFPSDATSTKLTFNAGLATTYASTTGVSATFVCLSTDCRTTWPTNAVSSVFSRTGAVVAQSGDYTTAQVTESGNLYWTDTRFDNRLSATTTLPNLTTLANLGTVKTSLSGLLKASSGVLSAASNGTDYTLITAKTCPGSDFLNSVTAAGVFGCGTPSGSSSVGNWFSPFANYNATSTPIGFLNGLFSTASTTFNSNVFFPNLTQGFAYIGTNGLHATVASSSLNLPNAALANSTVTVNSTSIALGASGTITAASSTVLTDANKFSGVNLFTNASSDFSGTWQTFSPSHFQTALGFTAVPTTRAINTTYPLQGGGDLSADRTLTTAFGTSTNWGLGASGFVVTNNSGAPFTTASSSLSLPNAALQNSTISGVALGLSLNSLTHDSTLTGTSYNGSAAVSNWGLDLTHANTWTGLQSLNGGASSTGEISAAIASSTKAYVSTLGGTGFRCVDSTSVGLLANTTTDCGSVTSVSASVPSLLSVSGSPITTSGTLAITYSGTPLPIANGGTNATSFTTSGSGVYYDGTRLLTAPLTSAVVYPYASTTVLSASGRVYSLGNIVPTFKSAGFNISTSTTWTASTTQAEGQLPASFTSQTIQSAQCYTDAGTLNVDIFHTSTHLALFNASTTQGVITFSSNNTMTAGEKWYFRAGTPASSPTSLTCTFKLLITSD